MSSQFALLGQRRFAPFFGAQALGAFNDNLLKNALVILAAYQGARLTRLDPGLLANLAGGLFVLPYLLFSGIAGQLADRFDKTLLIRIVKGAEVAIMALAGLGFARSDLGLLLGALFLMGLHSTFFAPAKYGLLPQVLHDTELVGGNALVEMGTFVAILLGTLAAGELAGAAAAAGTIAGTVADTAAGAGMGMGMGAGAGAGAGMGADIVSATGTGLGVDTSSGLGTGLLTTTMLGIAVAGLLASLAMPRLPAVAPRLVIDWNPWRASLANVRAARERRPVFLSILGISWFWAYGALVLAQLPLYASRVLNGDQRVLTLLLVTFSIGVAAGSLLCERLSGRKVEIGLVPFGSIGLTLFAIDLYFATPAVPPAAALGIGAFFESGGGWRIVADLGLLGVFGGFFIVPLYAMVQQRSPRERISRIQSANNILNALFMVAAAIVGAVALRAGWSVPQLLLFAGILNAGVAIYLYTLLPEFLLRFLAWLLVHFMYRLRVKGIEQVPEQGPALLICNHVSFVDAIVIAAACRRPVRFIMDSGIFRIPLLRSVFRGMKAVPIAPRSADTAVYERAFATVAAELEAGHLVCIFPEGKLTRDGAIDEFKGGLLRILERTPVPVVPMALSNLWPSMFSRREPVLWKRWPRRMLARVTLAIGAPIAAQDVTLESARERVAALRGRP
jgi:1-acyl-sn-glycerol-3-phosphate acyltransferase